MKITIVTANFNNSPKYNIPPQKTADSIQHFYYTNHNTDFPENTSPFFKEAYFKYQAYRLPEMQDQDLIIWLDKTEKVISANFIENIIAQLHTNPMAVVSENIFAYKLTAETKKMLDFCFKMAKPEKDGWSFLINKIWQKLKSYIIVSLPENSVRTIPNPRPIIGFYHIAMMHNWRSVVKEQLEILVSGGLMDAMDEMIIGCLGTEEDLQELYVMLAPYPKLSICYYSKNFKDYEFPTLHLIEEAVKHKSFYGFYFHTKSVSYQSSEGGIYWRDYMNYYNLNKWNDCIARLKEGYHTAGVKLLPAAKDFPMHYSGNFFHFDSEYILQTRPVNSFDKKDRFAAEKWICSGNPKPATLCQLFVDHNTKGKFYPPVPKRTVVHTLAFNLPEEVKTATGLLYAQNKTGFEHIIVDLGFPIETPDIIPADIEKAKANNSLALQKIASDYGSKYVKAPNVGVSQNWEWVRQQVNLPSNSVIICADPDERPKHDNWVSAVSNVLTAPGHKLAWCSLIMEEQAKVIDKYPHTVHFIAGYRVYVMDCIISWAQGGFNGKFLNEIGGIPAPEKAPIYGWIEDACYAQMKRLGWKWGILADYYVEHTECSPLYRAWKTQITSHVEKGQISFEQWLKSQNTKAI